MNEPHHKLFFPKHRFPSCVIKTILLYVVILCLPVLVWIWATLSYPLVDLRSNDPIYWLDLVVFIVSVMLIFLVVKHKQSRLRTPSRSGKLPSFITLIVICGFSVLPTMDLVGLFIGLNGALDDGKTIPAKYEVVNKRSYPSGRGGWSYEIRLTPYNTENETPTITLDGHYDIYSKVSIGSQLILDIKPGFFRRSWISGFRIIGTTP